MLAGSYICIDCLFVYVLFISFCYRIHPRLHYGVCVCDGVCVRVRVCVTAEDYASRVAKRVPDYGISLGLALRSTGTFD